MTIKTRLDPILLEVAKQEAFRQGISLTEYLRRLVLADLEDRHGSSLSGSLNGEGATGGH